MMPVATTATDIAPAAMALITGEVMICVPNGKLLSHDNGASLRVLRAIPTRRNARTTSRSNCEPAFAMSSSRAWAALCGSLYERAAVITSNTSATETIFALSEI